MPKETKSVGTTASSKFYSKTLRCGNYCKFLSLSKNVGTTTSYFKNILE
ncbi:hypothetical protein LEP1GSC021_2783 [Leptospira noguchii str. 1993005606]|uniref:Uncharacterized protein n=1 Tax=Leptospira noguchii str. 2001034031 TaxID=1193053 RepID=M6Y4C0_9LEPT|nr:hypothetical protein LEP1GSC024_1334 [Leptospira noguchii str. 2001034031]EPE85119.1 hypothetical protein LEP1GSC021_2783 [Leptospira noguchii str. 1993005606]